MPTFDNAVLIDVVIGLTLVEGAFLVIHHRRTGRGVAPREFGATLLSGLCLMAAMHGLARDAGVAWVALFLLAAGILHLADLASRWRGRPAVTPTLGHVPTHGSSLA